MMKKIILLLLGTYSLGIQAQNFGKINAMLDRLEERRGINQNLSDVSLEGKKFFSVTDFEDHTERQFIIFEPAGKISYIEIFDDKTNNQISSNVFSGTMLRSEAGVISIRANQLEGEKIPIPITKALQLNRIKNILYLIDVNNKTRWIEEKK